MFDVPEWRVAGFLQCAEVDVCYIQPPGRASAQKADGENWVDVDTLDPACDNAENITRCNRTFQHDLIILVEAICSLYSGARYDRTP